MGTSRYRDRSCTIQYPLDTYLILELADVMTSPVILFLIAVGAFHTGRYIRLYIWPHCARWAQSVLQKISVRVRTERNRRSPTIRPPARREPERRPGTPQNQNVETPGSLAILTPARNPPRALVNALHNYQDQAVIGPNSPRARTPKTKAKGALVNHDRPS